MHKKSFIWVGTFKILPNIMATSFENMNAMETDLFTYL